MARPFEDARKRRSRGSQKAFDPAKHPRGGDGRFVPTSESIGQAGRLAGQNATVHVEFAAVVRPGAIKKVTGVDVRGFRHSVSNQSISHTLKNHGNPKVETPRGQIAVTAADFEKLPQIIKSGVIHPPEPHKSTLPRFVIKAEIDGIGYHYVGDVKAGKRRLDMVSLRKKKGSW